MIFHMEDYRDVNRVFRNTLLRAAYFMNCKDPSRSMRDRIMVNKHAKVKNPSLDVRDDHRRCMLSHYLVCPTIRKLIAAHNADKNTSGPERVTLEAAMVSFRLRKRCLYCGKKSTTIIREHEEADMKIRNITLGKADQLDIRHTFMYGETNHRVMKKKLEAMESPTKDKRSIAYRRTIDYRIEQVQNAITRLQLLSNGGDTFKNLREAILWLLKIRTEKIKLIPILSKREEEIDEEQVVETTLALLRQKLLPADSSNTNVIFEMLPNVILNYVFGKFLTLKETISISMTNRHGYTYVYDNSDSGGPWKNLAQHDQTSVLLQPFKDDAGGAEYRFWRYEFLKRHLRFLSELTTLLLYLHSYNSK